MGDTTDDQQDTETTDTGNGDQQDVKTEDEADTSQNSDANDADESAEDGTDTSDEGSSDDSESDTDTDDDTEEDVDADEEPPMRKPKAGAPNSEWAAWRAQQKKDNSNQSDDSNNDTSEDGDDDVDDEDAKLIDSRINKALEPYQKRELEREVDADIDSFLKKNPDFQRFAAKARNWALHPNRQGVPVKSIFYEIAGDKLMAMGAKRAKEADRKAAQTRAAIGQAGDVKGGSKDYANMPLKDFEQELEQAKLKR